jgi:hypothetical protein
MPFLVGLPVQLLPVLRNMPMERYTLIDLDLGRQGDPPHAHNVHPSGVMRPQLTILKT